MGLFRDRYAEAKGVERYERQVNRMKSHTPPKKSAPAPHVCGAACRPNYSCPSIVRGGVCPCRDC